MSNLELMASTEFRSFNISREPSMARFGNNRGSSGVIRARPGLVLEVRGSSRGCPGLSGGHPGLSGDHPGISGITRAREPWLNRGSYAQIT